jgi:TonB family protein
MDSFSELRRLDFNSWFFVLACMSTMPLAPGLSRADCSVDPAHFKLTYSDKAIVARNLFFTSMCGGKRGDLFDFSDPALVGRLERPSKIVNTHTGDYYPDSAKRKYHEGNTITAYVVEANGDVLDASIIVSSGYDDLDRAAVNALKHVHFDRPGKLDGNAVRVLMYFPINWKLTGG